jgi:hypothetical protein
MEEEIKNINTVCSDIFIKYAQENSTGKMNNVEYDFRCRAVADVRDEFLKQFAAGKLNYVHKFSKKPNFITLVFKKLKEIWFF